MRVGYARVSTTHQDLERQLIILKEYGVEKIFQEKISGVNRDRGELDNLLSFVREGDTVYVESLSRLGRSLQQLISIMQTLDEKKVNIVFQKENIDTSTSSGKLVFHIFGALSEYEREMIIARAKEGQEIARANGKQIGRPSTKLTVDNIYFQKVIDKWYSSDITSKDAQFLLDMKNAMFYRRANEYAIKYDRPIPIRPVSNRGHSEQELLSIKEDIMLEIQNDIERQQELLKVK